MKNILLALSLLSFAACSKDASGGGSTCDKAVDNSVAILKKEMPQAPAGDRAEMMAKCQKLSADKQACGANAKSLADLMACGQ